MRTDNTFRYFFTLEDENKWNDKEDYDILRRLWSDLLRFIPYRYLIPDKERHSS